MLWKFWQKYKNNFSFYPLSLSTEIMGMEYGIVQASFIPVRKEADSTSEMTSQLLFGEIFEVLEPGDKYMKMA